MMAGQPAWADSLMRFGSTGEEICEKRLIVIMGNEDHFVDAEIPGVSWALPGPLVLRVKIE
jgi:hypothetical protein